MVRRWHRAGPRHTRREWRRSQCGRGRLPLDPHVHVGLAAPAAARGAHRAAERRVTQRPRRVLMVTVEWPRDTWGGTAHFIVRQAEYLRAAGLEVDVHDFVGARDPRNYVRAWRDVRRRLKTGRYDLVHAQFGQSALAALPCPLPL